jgi:hypothetical protein
VHLRRCRHFTDVLKLVGHYEAYRRGEVGRVPLNLWHRIERQVPLSAEERASGIYWYNTYRYR